MPNVAAAPNEADSLRRMAQAMKRVHCPAPLLHLLLTLLALVFRNGSAVAHLATEGVSLATATGRTWRTPLRDWQFSPTGETIDDLAPVLHPRALRRLRRQRAWIGWILRGRPGRGMRRSGQRAPAPRPLRTARAPPWPARTPRHHESVSKPRLARRRLMPGQIPAPAPPASSPPESKRAPRCREARASFLRCPADQSAPACAMSAGAS